MDPNQKFNIDVELENLQCESFEYFLREVNLENGLILDKTAPNWPASIAATGLALAAYPIAVKRNYMSYEEALKRTLTTLRFFWNSPQGSEPDATGYKGFYYHFLDMQTGRRVWECELSTVDTAFLIAGMLTASVYFRGDTQDEKEIRKLAEDLYSRVDWQWAQNKGNTVTHGWKPETGFLPYRWEGYDEALLLYILGLGSPSYPLDPASYQAWASSYEWKNIYDIEYLYAGSFFTHQLSHIWIDFRNIQDDYMREKGIDYFENSRRATYVQQQYAMQNPLNYTGYNHCSFGITASDGPGFIKLKIDGIERQFYDYIARAVPYGPDDGTLAPWAAVTSLPFAPEIVLPLIEHCIYRLKLKFGNQYGFKATYNQTFTKDLNIKIDDLNTKLNIEALNQMPENDFWISPYHFGINQGPIVLMTENYRNDFLWRLMKDCPHIIKGLKSAGFSGGYLE